MKSCKIPIKVWNFTDNILDFTQTFYVWYLLGRFFLTYIIIGQLDSWWILDSSDCFLDISVKITALNNFITNWHSHYIWLLYAYKMSIKETYIRSHAYIVNFRAHIMFNMKWSNVHLTAFFSTAVVFIKAATWKIEYKIIIRRGMEYSYLYVCSIVFFCQGQPEQHKV